MNNNQTLRDFREETCIPFKEEFLNYNDSKVIINNEIFRHRLRQLFSKDKYQNDFYFDIITRKIDDFEGIYKKYTTFISYFCNTDLALLETSTFHPLINKINRKDLANKSEIDYNVINKGYDKYTFDIMTPQKFLAEIYEPKTKEFEKNVKKFLKIKDAIFNLLLLQKQCNKEKIAA